ncbi:divalent-cation tolerance protein CutA [Aestuariibacter halophilus]|uniref:Divalent-cation tolerance protein CutA n=1 Tax=Fluctibacter halophilus TaxID=226011 RepID=A0ABS8G965_9ALTE|nr:divalent-cation tolerance protein CutA [Aestuariibacter halophilus]MCC2617102.1 divalent-cation tolerance protein CutA [Aestuariibacter halophilus]
MSDIRIALCTCPDMASAQHIAQQIIAQRLAACVNILPGITSLYWWDDAVQQDNEVQLVIKTCDNALAELSKTVHQAHPYDTPEWLVLTAVDASEQYAQWMRSYLK